LAETLLRVKVKLLVAFLTLNEQFCLPLVTFKVQRPVALFWHTGGCGTGTGGTQHEQLVALTLEPLVRLTKNDTVVQLQDDLLKLDEAETLLL
jgi:hypothetical protein